MTSRERLRADLVHAARRLRRSPASAAALLAVLALGVAAASTALLVVESGRAARPPIVSPSGLPLPVRTLGTDAARPAIGELPAGPPLLGMARGQAPAERRSVAAVQREALRTLLATLLAIAAGTVALVCVGAGLLALSRGATRRGEIVMRRVLGAPRRSVLGPLLAEALLLLAPALALGGAAAAGLVAILRAHWPAGFTPWLASPRAGPLTALAVLLPVLGTLGLSLAPALAARGASLASRIAGAGRVTAGPREGWLRRRLVVAMVGSAFTLLAASMLLLRGFSGAGGEAGMDARGVLTVSVQPPQTGPLERAELYRTLLARIAREPGVKAESLSSEGAWLGLGSTERVQAFVGAANPTLPGLMGTARLHSVSPGYFRSLGIPVRQGREFTGEDRAGRPRVVVVNEQFAYRLFPRLDPIGKQIQLGGATLHGDWYTVVGVVPSLQPPGIGTPAEPIEAVYLPLLQLPPPRAGLAVRAAEPARALAAVRRAAGGLGRGWRFGAPGTLEDELARFRSPLHWFGQLLAGLAALTTLLAALGLAGVVAHSVQRRTREIGVRLAIGARPRQVVTMVVKEGLALAATGTVLGLAGALCVGRLLQFHFHGVRLGDPLVLGGVGGLVAATALLASWVPARRAAGVDPVVALRAE